MAANWSISRFVLNKCSVWMHEVVARHRVEPGENLVLFYGCTINLNIIKEENYRSCHLANANEWGHWNPESSQKCKQRVSVMLPTLVVVRLLHRNWIGNILLSEFIKIELETVREIRGRAQNRFKPLEKRKLFKKENGKANSATLSSGPCGWTISILNFFENVLCRKVT